MHKQTTKQLTTNDSNDIDITWRGLAACIGAQAGRPPLGIRHDP